MTDTGKLVADMTPEEIGEVNEQMPQPDDLHPETRLLDAIRNTQAGRMPHLAPNPQYEMLARLSALMRGGRS